MFKQIIFVIVLLAFTYEIGRIAEGLEGCSSLQNKSIKIEAWISKKHRKNKKAIKKEMGKIKGAKLRMRVYPMKDPQNVIGIGRCVPASIGRHSIEQSLKYAGGVGSMVDQEIISPYWVGIGTMAFDEHSQKTITEEQLKSLRNPSLNDIEFQNLVKKFSTPDESVPMFGQDLPNSRRVDVTPAWEKKRTWDTSEKN
tara:strand:- start:218 stop:808 length:591 start_codon:yes stop_codon:yes gene_type:complete